MILFCSFPNDDDQENANTIIDTFLGLNDSSFVETSLSLYEGGEFRIVKDDEIKIVGYWQIQSQTELILNAENQHWNLKIENQNSDSLVLKFEGPYQSFTSLQMVLKQ